MEKRTNDSVKTTRLMKAAFGVSGVMICALLAFFATLTFWHVFSAVCVSAVAFFFAISTNHRERQETFRDLNTRTREWRERWAYENAWSPTAIDSYVHLSAEKYWAYRNGLVASDVWETWRAEMEFYFSKDAFVERWHLEKNDGLYGFHPSVVSHEFPRDLDAVIARKIARQEREAS